MWWSSYIPFTWMGSVGFRCKHDLIPSIASLVIEAFSLIKKWGAAKQQWSNCRLVNTQTCNRLQTETFKSVCRRQWPYEFTLLNLFSNLLFTLSSKKMTDKTKIPSVLPFCLRQCSCGEFYLINKLTASSASTIWTITLIFCTVLQL